MQRGCRDKSCVRSEFVSTSHERRGSSLGQGLVSIDYHNSVVDEQAERVQRPTKSSPFPPSIVHLVSMPQYQRTPRTCDVLLILPVLASALRSLSANHSVSIVRRTVPSILYSGSYAVEDIDQCVFVGATDDLVVSPEFFCKSPAHDNCGQCLFPAEFTGSSSDLGLSR